MCPDTLGNAPKSSWRPFVQYLKGIGDSLGKAQIVLKAFQQSLQSRAYTLGNAEINVETRWAHFPSGLQPIGNKETTSA